MRSPGRLGALVAAVPCVLAATRSSTAAPASSLTLEQAVRLAVARDERSEIAAQEVAVAGADVSRARAFFFPEVSLSGDYRFRRDPGNFQARNVFSAQLAGRLTLLDGRGFPLLRAARRGREASDADRAGTRRQVGFEAAAAFLATLGTQSVLEAARQRVEFAGENLKDARGRVEAQLASSNDVTRAELEQATATLELRRAQGEQAEARLQLGWLLGVEIDRPLAAPEWLLAEAAEPAPPAARGPAARRFDLVSLAARAAAADALAEEPLWRWAPTLGLVGEANTSSVSGFSGKSTDWFVGLSAMWQLWDGGERGADRDARVAEARIAELRLTQEARRASLEVRSARAALDAARASVKEAVTGVDRARRNVEETRTLYRQGLARALEVADAGAQLFAAEVAVARERVGLGVAQLDLRAARGMDPVDEGGGGLERRP